MPLYPIGFSIHDSKIAKTIPKKTRLLAPLIPGDQSTYIYNNETDYYNNYKESIFGLTTKKAGWDCMRHYEILACGCIPLFPDLEKCPPHTMTHIPKGIIMSSNNLFVELNKYASFEEIPQELKELCNSYIQYYLQYTRDYLTNEKIAQYVLNKSGKTHVKRILYLSGNLFSDYLRCVTLTGFKQLLGTECHDYPKVPHIYNDYPIEDVPVKCYGKGMSYARILDASLHNDDYDNTILNDIKNHKYDLIIYGSYHRGIPLWNEVNQSYTSDEIILFCGEDFHKCNYEIFLQKGYHLFVRELTDHILKL
jgi:hypothetical protein